MGLCPCTNFLEENESDFRVAQAKSMSPHTVRMAGLRVEARHTGKRKMERAMGIEPTSPAWKAGALPLCYARNQALTTISLLRA
jgi:hypothetical protein